MLYYTYDNTFEGLLTALFDAFNRRERPDRLVPETTPVPLFTETFTVYTDDEKSTRVLNALKKKISGSALNMLLICFLAESDRVRKRIFDYIAKAVVAPGSIELNFGDEDVLELSKVYKKVWNERTRIIQFVRFQKTLDGTFFAVVDPQFDVLPLCPGFFRDRYADQPWILYDIRRNYGLYYDLKKTEIVHFDKLPASAQTGRLDEETLDDYEKAFRQLWKDYLQAITIRERKNLKLQRQHMPVRFWKYMTEKQ